MVSTLSATRKSGVLSLHVDDFWGRVIFEKGKIAYAHAKDLPTLGRYLLNKGFLHAGELDWLLARQEEVLTVSLGALAVEEGFLSFEELGNALASQVVDVLVEMVTWGRVGRGEMLLDERDDLHLEIASARLPETEQLILQALTRLDESDHRTEERNQNSSNATEILPPEKLGLHHA